MATRYAPPRDQVLGDTGTPLAGAKLYFYVGGTSNPKATYSDAGLTVPNPNPVIADSAGRYGDIFLTTGAYKAIQKTAADVTVWTADAVEGAINGGATATTAGNLLINGDFQINQRGLTSVANDTYCLDRWYALMQSGNVTVAQQTIQEDGQAANIRLAQADATAKRIGIAQIVEARDSYFLRGVAVAFSARVRCSLAQPIRYAILAWTGTADAVTSDVVADWTSNSYAPSGFFLASNLVVVAVGSTTPAANFWTSLPTITGIVSSSANNLICIIWSQGVLPQTATLDIGLTRLLSGETASTFPARLVGIELGLCMRYYQSIESSARFAAPYGSAFLDVPIIYPVPMKNYPTLYLTVSGSVLNLGFGDTLNSVTPFSARHELYSGSAGDCYALNRTFLLDAEI